MILEKAYTHWIASISFPTGLRSVPEQCKRCHHYASSILVATPTGYAPMRENLKTMSDLHFVDGDFCVRFDHEEYWDEQKITRMENCRTFEQREDGVTYIREAAPFVVKPWWIG
jgi:hypothetical protein